MQNDIGIKQTRLDYNPVYFKSVSSTMVLRCWLNADRRKPIPADLVTYLRISHKPRIVFGAWARRMFGGYVGYG